MVTYDEREDEGRETETLQRCAGVNRFGEPCQHRPRSESNYCSTHQGQAEAAKRVVRRSSPRPKDSIILFSIVLAATSDGQQTAKLRMSSAPTDTNLGWARQVVSQFVAWAIENPDAAKRLMPEKDNKWEL